MVRDNKPVSLRKLATEIGIVHRSIYHHFPDKKTLLAEVAGDGFLMLGDRMTKAKNRDKLMRIYLDFAFDEPGLYDLMMNQDNAVMFSNRHLGKGVRSVIDQTLRVLGDTTQDSETNRYLVMALWAKLHGIVSLHRGGVLEARSKADLLNLAVKLDHF